MAAEASAAETWACIGSGCLMLANEDLTKAFDAVDKDGDGFIAYEELSAAVVTLSGEKLSDAEVEEMLKEVDTNQDGKIDFTEFVQAMTKTEPQPARATW